MNINGLFTHLCSADLPGQNAFTDLQLSLFNDIVFRVKDLSLQYIHCLNSAGGLWFSSNETNLVRLGIIMYGLKPDYKNSLPKGIEPILSWKSVVSMVKTVNPNETIGYGRSFSTNHPIVVATIPTGYADGYPRLLSNKGWVLINGCRAPIVGKICMDQMMVDVTSISNVKYETEVILIGDSGDERITADEIGNLIGTIGYEIVCGINKRVDRVYTE